MRIVVNDIAASKTGALAILKDFYQYVREYATEHEWIFLTGDDYLEKTEHISIQVMKEVKKSQKNRLMFDLVQGSSFIEKLKPDVVLSLQNTLTRGNIRKPDGSLVPQVLYVHQPLGFQKTKRFSFFKKEEREYAVYQYLIGALIDASIKRASFVIVQTQWMKQAVISKTNINEVKIANILPDIPDLSTFRNIGEFESNQFFFPSGEILYKNHECILKAVKLLNEKKIHDFQVHFTLKGLLDVTKRTYDDPFHNVIWSGRLSRQEVFSWYNRATLIFPSYIETFGVPLAEARQMGAIILASDCPFCHEVLDGYQNAYYFPPFQPDKLADLMEQVIGGRIIRMETKKIEQKKSENSYQKIVELVQQAAENTFE